MSDPVKVPVKAAPQDAQFTSSIRHDINGHINIYRFTVKSGTDGQGSPWAPPFPTALLSLDGAFPESQRDGENIIRNGPGTLVKLMTCKSADGWNPSLDAWAKAGWPVQRIPSAAELLPDVLSSEGNIRVKGTAIMMHNVASSNVHAIGYDADSSTLYVRFLGQSKSAGVTDHRNIYAYTKVAPDIWNGLRKAESIGAYLTGNVKRNPAIVCTKLY